MSAQQKTALIMLYNKGLIEQNFKQLQALVEMGWKIVGSGGTVKALAQVNILAQDIAEFVGGQAILGHRVVSISREMAAALLAQDNEADRKELEELGLSWIDMVWVDLYPLADAITAPKATLESVLEKNDIGGVLALREAAKGKRIVVSDPEDLPVIIEWLQKGEQDGGEFIRNLAAKAEALAANYSLMLARFMSGVVGGFIGSRLIVCAYGENGWQTPAGLYISPDTAGDPLSLDKLQPAGGGAPSYNNLADIDRLLQTATHIAAGIDANQKVFGVKDMPLLAIGVKHGNPCGAAIGQDPKEVLEKMIAGNPLALFGGLVLVNFHITKELAEFIGEHKCLFDGIIAPAIDADAAAVMERKRGKCRMFANPALSSLNLESLDASQRFRYVRGGFLSQPNCTFVMDLGSKELQRHGEFTSQQFQDAVLAWAIGSTSNSNTITIVKNGMLLGNGVGQQARVYGAHTAVYLAGMADNNLIGATAYSDSFFPFPDGVEELAKAGITAILTSSGSIHDQDVIARAKELGVSLLMFPDKLGRGFFGH